MFDIGSAPAAKQATAFVDEPRRLPLLTALKNQGDVLEMTHESASMDLLDKAKREMKVISKAMCSICHIYDAVFRNLEEHDRAGAKEEEVESVDILLCKHSYSLKSQRELENTSHHMFDQRSSEGFCNLANTLENPGNCGHMFCSVLHFFSWRLRY